MQKIARRLSTAVLAIFTAFTALSYMPAKAATAAVVPKVQYVSAPQLEYTAGDRVQFNLNAPNYGGRVQYRVVLWDNNKKEMRDLWPTGDRYYTNWQPYGNETFTLGWPISEPGSYRITIYAKRAGVANSNTALKGYNCDSYMESAAFVVKAKVQEPSAASKVEAYEKAPLTTADQITAAEALKADAVAAIAKVDNAADKAALQARVDAQDKIVEAAKYVHVTDVKAIDANTLKVTFDKEVAVNAKNFKIYEKDNSFYTLLVDTVKADKNVATVKVFDNLETDKNYVVEVSGATSADSKLVMKETVSKDFTFVKAEAASIAFVSNKVKVGDEVKYVIKDAQGNDITANFVLGDDVVVETTDATVVDSDLTALKTGYAVVNVYLKDTEIKTGNTIINAYVDADSKLAKLGAFSLGNTNFTKPTVDLYYSDALTSTKLNVQLIDQYDKDFDGTVSYTYVSSNPTVALINADGNITPLSVGNANITVIATQMNGTDVVAKVSKTYAVAVKAAKKATTLKVDRTSVKVVKGSNIVEKIHVSVLDQYGNVFENTNNVTVTADKANIVTFATPAALVDGEKDIDLAAGTTNGTAKLTLEYTGLAKVTVTVDNINAGDFAGYVAVPAATTLDLIPSTNDQYTDLKKGPAATTIAVYKKDANGVKFEKLADTDFSIVSLQSDESKRILDLTTDGAVKSDEKTGTETVAVKVNNVTVGTFTFTVVDSEPVLTKVVQAKDAISVSTGSIAEDLFGKYDSTNKEYETKGAFVGYDQYGNEIAISSSSIISSDENVILNTNALTAGKATLVIKIADKFYQLEVLVK